ncbi:hypothetical protein RHMOL_Rhmol01G0113900 [Rhododendron molle]|uniref:Uncharacterized protein n=1 Tax=Rhododendron molle TaxID=49168 RepID=A0ACC0Q3L3_RHOML|nr:hypothetical protein RHMOL_Rhmol01G0113900 [Rhododendron molle]
MTFVWTITIPKVCDILLFLFRLTISQPYRSTGTMENAVVLLCKRGDVSCGVLLERTLSFQSLMTKLCAKWKDLTEGSFSLSFSVAGHPQCLLECDEDLCVLYALTLSSRTEFVDVAVKDLVDTSMVSTVVDVCSSSGDVGCDQLVLLDCVGTQVDLPPSFSDNNKSKVLKSAGWCTAIVGVGQVFVDGAVGFRDALFMYSLFHGFKYVYTKNDAHTVKAVCLERHTSKECKWIVKAKLEMPSGYFVIKQFVGEHTCGDASLSYSSSRSTSSFVSRLVSEDMRSDESKRPVEVMKDMKKDYGVEITYRRAWMAVKKARAHVYGDYMESFKELSWYVGAFRASNPDSMCVLERHDSDHFKRMFLGFAACKYGFTFCRPILFVDGTFLKSTHNGCLLSACAKDGNQGLYPLCLAVVDSENYENWHWFMEQLKDFLEDGRVLVFVSDRHDGLLQAVKQIFPSSPHSHCLVHLKENLKKRFGGLDNSKKKYLLNLFNLCAYAPTVREFEKLMNKLKKEGGVKVSAFLDTLDNEHWCHAYFPGKRYGELSSNLVECFNNWIKKERSLPITLLFDKIRLKIMEQLSARRSISMKWKGVICPIMEKKFKGLFNVSKTWAISRSSDDLYEVRCDPSVSVNIASRSCSCGEWQINSFPCAHAFCALKRAEKNLNDYVDHYYSVHAFQNTYSKSINPVPTIWKDVTVGSDGNVLLPPLCNKRPPGRPRTERIPSTGVKTRKITCGRCGQVGRHNRARCKEPLEH